MAEAVEGGAALAWRLLATLEGGSLVLATAVLIAYTARSRPASVCVRTPVKTVLITNTSNDLGKELQHRLCCAGCVVRTAPVGGTKEDVYPTVDAIVVVGAERRAAAGLDGMADVVSKDVYSNLKVLEEVSPLVRRGGSIAWVCSGHTGGSFGGADQALDNVIRASVTHIAQTRGCETVWVARGDSSADSAKRLVQALLSGDSAHVSRFTFRYAASKVSGYISRWLKIAT